MKAEIINDECNRSTVWVPRLTSLSYFSSSIICASLILSKSPNQELGKYNLKLMSPAIFQLHFWQCERCVVNHQSDY